MSTSPRLPLIEQCCTHDLDPGVNRLPQQKADAAEKWKESREQRPPNTLTSSTRGLTSAAAGVPRGRDQRSLLYTRTAIASCGCCASGAWRQSKTALMPQQEGKVRGPDFHSHIGLLRQDVSCKFLHLQRDNRSAPKALATAACGPQNAQTASLWARQICCCRAPHTAPAARCTAPAATACTLNESVSLVLR